MIDKERERYVEELVNEIKDDFKRRQKERVSFERQWELNMNFLRGNQYVDLSPKGEIETEGKEYYWQNRNVFNHIAPIMESRLSKLVRVMPDVSVRPKSNDDKDVNSAKISEKLLEQAFKITDFSETVRQVTGWSEICGTAFYKVIWQNDGGEMIGEVEGKGVYEGETDILPVSPFEIFPDSLYRDDIDDCKSIIQARAMSVDEVYRKYRVTVVGEDIDVFSLEKTNGNYLGESGKNKVVNSAVVIEKYYAPTEEYPQGRLITVCGDKLLYIGELPYINKKNNMRGYPFVKQDSISVSGCFFGKSIIERLIPVQKSFNAVKNRKHEFLNRLSMGIVTVEDGSVDVDNLCEEGLSPGKVVVYRQGSKAPELMDDFTMPNDFNAEEDKLLNEFVAISGVSEVSSNSNNARVTSGTALEMLINQDNERMTLTADNIRKCFIEVSVQVLRLYTQFIQGVKVVKFSDGTGKIKTVYADKNTLNSYDVYLNGENELMYTPSQKKEMLFKLHESGLLNDDKGELRSNVKEKVLSLMGFGYLDYGNGLSKLHESKAQDENPKIREKGLDIEIIDDDEIHIDEHIRYVLSEYNELSTEQKQRFFTHIEQHKNRLKENDRVIAEEI